jgi:Flp pilus assembly protein CpaB
MKQWVIASALAGSLALAGVVQAQETAKKPAPAKSQAAGETRAPKQQPTTAQDPNVADSAMALGTVHIPKAVKADNKPLPAGTYQVRLTTDEAKPDAVGTSGKLERWVEFLKGGKVAGREVVTIVPQSEIAMVQKDKPPASGASKVELLKGGDYLRVWINKGGNHYLIHLPVG